MSLREGNKVGEKLKRQSTEVLHRPSGDSPALLSKPWQHCDARSPVPNDSVVPWYGLECFLIIRWPLSQSKSSFILGIWFAQDMDFHSIGPCYIVWLFWRKNTRFFFFSDILYTHWPHQPVFHFETWPCTCPALMVVHSPAHSSAVSLPQLNF